MWLPLFIISKGNSLKTTLISCVIRFWNSAEHQALTCQSIPKAGLADRLFTECM